MPDALQVLIVEDSEDDAGLLVRHLGRGGYEVCFERVEDRAALETAWASRRWDLVISDFSMPHFSGTDALRLLRAKGAEVPFIFVSGTIGEETAVAALKDGAQDYLMKSRLERLVPAVQRALQEAGERRQRKLLEQQVQQLQKFEAIGRLAGGIAHDFNNVIGAILDWAELGCEEADPGSPFHLRFRQIRDQALWATKLTLQLLAFARRQLLQPRRVDLNQLIETQAAVLRTMVGQSVDLRIAPGSGLPSILADPTQIEQILMNLCTNARDALPAGGRITIETASVVLGEDFSKLPADASPGRYVQLTVSDTGIGMDAATLERIFEPFFTTKPAGRGTGLGLATVYGVVKQHGGFLQVESEPGKGTAFRIHLPVSSEAAEPAAAKPEARPRPASETILLAEDNQGIRSAAQQLLESLGYRVLPAGDGSEALRIFREHAGGIDLLVLDVQMPALSGPETYAQICKLQPDVAVLFTTGLAADAASLNPSLGRYASVLQKPYRLTALSQAVRGLLDQKPPAC